jgi:hypothetical protein
MTELKQSRNFKPLLHVGWRLAPYSRTKAIPLHLFAGDNFAADYQQKLKKYNSALAEFSRQQQRAAIEKLSTDSINSANGTETTATNSQPQALSAEHLQQKVEQLALLDIVEKSKNFAFTKAEVLAQLDARENAAITVNENTIKAPTPPKPPIQPWYLDGYFTVHLNHYLFITAEFNVMNKTLAEIASDALKPNPIMLSANNNAVATPKSSELKAIHFEQNRRVISQEIHYFDHPYIGMIVQIRRYSAPELEDESALQSNNN